VLDEVGERQAVSRATACGRPIWANMYRLEVKVSRPRSAGEVVAWPRSVLLPPSQASTSETNDGLSLRSVSSMSLDSMATGTL
jgi:hypothetical protein